MVGFLVTMTDMALAPKGDNMALKYTHDRFPIDDRASVVVEEHTHLRLNYYVRLHGTPDADGYVGGFRALGDARSFALMLRDRISRHQDRVGV